MNVIIPMAGEGRRFSDVGYDKPKPLIDVLGKSMIQAVIDNLQLNSFEGNRIFIIQKSHEKEFNLSAIIEMYCPKAIIVQIDGVTEGPACTALIAKKFIDKEPLIIVNCDQIIDDFSVRDLKEFARINGADGVLGAFISTSKKNSYMQLDPNGEVTDVKEKIVISNTATNGLHFWSNGLDFVLSAEKMIEQNERYNNEFYIAPTYNHLIKEGKKILPFFYNLHFPIGTPEDLKKYIKLYESTEI